MQKGTDLLENILEGSSKSEHVDISNIHQRNKTEKSLLVGKWKSTRQSKNKIKVLKLVRPLKLDIRKQYCIMFLNILNSFDLLLLDEFVQQFSTKDCSFNHIASGILIPFPPEFHLIGTKPMLDYWKGIFISTPDACLKLKKIKIKERSDTKGFQLTCKFTLEGTTLFDIELYDWLPSLKEQVAVQAVTQLSDAQDSTTLIGKEKLNAMKISKNVGSRINVLKDVDKEVFCFGPKTLREPKKVVINYTMRLFMTKNHCAEWAILECCTGL